MAGRGEVQERIATLARTGDIEIIPLKSVQEQLKAIPKHTTVAVTCSAKFGIDRTIEYVERLAKDGYRVRPHLAARQVPSKAYLGEFVEAMKGLGVRDLFVPGGDAEEPAGPYASSAELLEDLATMDHGFTISVTCYPEGHPKISDEALLQALKQKQPIAHLMISQLCFDPRALVSWLGATRAAGITMPLRLGLAAPMNPAKLADLSLKIGVGTSVRFLSKQHGIIGTLLRGKFYKPEKLLAEMGEALLSPEMNIDGLHLFSFNQVTATVEWQQRVGGGH
jgi:methylenetetrahydrofolate reductase (NADPH)